jgi:hypothetical protein
MNLHREQSRDVVQRDKGHGYSDEIGQWMIDAFHADRNPPATDQGKLPHPSTPEEVQSTLPASPSPEVEQPAVLTGPSGTGDGGQSRA